jgi:hypothetical protein
MNVARNFCFLTVSLIGISGLRGTQDITLPATAFSKTYLWADFGKVSLSFALMASLFLWPRCFWFFPFHLKKWFHFMEEL